MPRHCPWSLLNVSNASISPSFKNHKRCEPAWCIQKHHTKRSKPGNIFQLLQTKLWIKVNSTWNFYDKTEQKQANSHTKQLNKRQKLSRQTLTTVTVMIKTYYSCKNHVLYTKTGLAERRSDHWIFPDRSFFLWIQEYRNSPERGFHQNPFSTVHVPV